MQQDEDYETEDPCAMYEEYDILTGELIDCRCYEPEDWLWGLEDAIEVSAITGNIVFYEGERTYVSHVFDWCYRSDGSCDVDGGPGHYAEIRDAATRKCVDLFADEHLSEVCEFVERALAVGAGRFFAIIDEDPPFVIADGVPLSGNGGCEAILAFAEGRRALRIPSCS